MVHIQYRLKGQSQINALNASGETADCLLLSSAYCEQPFDYVQAIGTFNPAPKHALRFGELLAW